MIDERRLKTQEVVESAHSLVAHYGALAESGAMPRAQAQELAKISLRAIRFGDGNYVWINDMDGVVVMHPVKPDIIGKSMMNAVDGSGRHHWREFVETVRSEGAGFVSYTYQPPRQGDALRSKISYVKGFKPWGWVVGTGDYIDDVEAAFLTNVLRGGVAIAVIALLTTLLSMVVGRSVGAPIRSLAQVMRRLADRDLSVDIPDCGGGEIGDMATAVGIFRDKLVEADRLAGEQERAQASRLERMRRVEAVCSAFSDESAEVSVRYAATAGSLQDAAHVMASSADETLRLAEAVAASSEQTGSNVRMVAAAADKLTVSVHDIGRQISRSAEFAGTTYRRVQETSGEVTQLSEAVARIGAIVTLISDVADQTNLLALNATIEAARAGAAGKGFAVVAGEVKNLAAQTARATKEIEDCIGLVQARTQSVVASIDDINRQVREMDGATAAISAAVDEQARAVAEIARNAEQAATGTAEVSRATAGVSAAAETTTSASGKVRDSSGVVAESARALRASVDEFIGEMRAA